MKIPDKFEVQVRRSDKTTEIDLIIDAVVHNFTVPDALLGQAWALAKTFFSKNRAEKSP